MALHREFRYIHEPLPVDDPAIPVLGHGELVADLRRRLTYSHGGTFLITGFRGVGKSTLVMRALEEAARARPAGDVLLPVHLNVARHMESDQLLFAVVRRVFETLEDRGLMEQLPGDVQNALILAYMRTSLSFKQTHSEGSERGGTVGMSASQGPLGPFSPNANLSGKQMSSRATEASFLAYSELDVEHDLVRIIQLLDHGHVRSERRGLLRRRRTTRLRIHPVVVLDEVDKLTENSQDALTALEALLGRLKSVLTSRGAHFLLIGGPDLHDSALRDADRGNGLYESVFAWRMYVPCLWEAPERLIRELVRRGAAEDRDDTVPVAGRPGAGSPIAGGAPGTPDLGPDPGPGPGPNSGPGPSPSPSQDASPGPDPGPWSDDTTQGDALPLEHLIRYLRFKSRGVLRRLLQELNALVVWDDDSGRPALVLDEDTLLRVAFYSELESVVAETVTPGSGRAGQALLPLDEDRRRLGGFHILDWILRSRGRAFTAGEIESEIDPLLHVDLPFIDRLLRHLVRRNVITVVSERGGADRTVIGNVAAVGAAYYRLSDAYADRLPGLVRFSESERADLGLAGVFADSVVRSSVSDRSSVSGGRAAIDSGFLTAVTGARLMTRLAGRYEVGPLIGQGGMGAVYRGRDLQTGDDVAVKMLNTALITDEAMRARFRREASIGMRIRHRHIARTVDVVEEPNLALIMEHIEGPTLRTLIRDEGPLTPGRTAVLAQQLGSALVHLAHLRLSRIDLKPSNVILHRDRGGVIVDLGLVHGTRGDASLPEITLAGMMVGTPGYMSPEQLNGETLDIRSDIFTLGLLLWECLMGRSPFAEGPVQARLYAIVNEDVDPSPLPVSPQLKTVVRRCTARDPRERYQTPEQFLEDLEGTPEAGERNSGAV
ncbi:serine/threonine-protein kinase [Streptomyces sp. NPDC059783]|uniref:serine/threonine-protein kinase n=1 Tax=Streptomyces sp. NPDC059783 TaxID=3346944 RepID=UPI00364D6740